MKPYSNITLIGMPASGKSTVGVILAKRLGMRFVDTDLLIQEQEKRLLKEIIAQEGLEGFREIENRVNRELRVENTIIAPGGSVIYCEEAMEHFRKISLVIYLEVSYEMLENRLGDLKERGVVLADGMTLLDLYQERVPLYERYADLKITEKQEDIGPVVDEIRHLLQK